MNGWVTETKLTAGVDIFEQLLQSRAAEVSAGKAAVIRWTRVNVRRCMNFSADLEIVVTIGFYDLNAVHWFWVSAH